MKPNILSFRLIKSEVDKFKTEHSFENESKAFLAFAIEKHLGIDIDEINESIIDGSHDKGIDAIYIDDETEDRPVVYLFQSKYYQNEEKFDRAFEGNAVDKMRQAIENLILKSPKNLPEANAFLLGKLKDIKSLSNPRFQIVFCANSAAPADIARNEFDQFVKDNSQGQGFFKVEYLTLEKLLALVTPATARSVNAKLKLSGTYFEWSLGQVRVIVGRVSGRELAELCKREGKDLFDINVRGYLSKKNSVNKEIYRSATNPIEGSNFFILNNGVTIVCKSVSYLPIADSPEIEISSLQIVNGGQTTNSIFEALQANALVDSLYVLIKIIATESKDLIEKIAESTNAQTNVRTRDLRSNDQIQKAIERLLLNQGFYYESRKNKFRESPAAKGKRIDMEVAAQAYYSFICQKPADAKNKKRQLFGPLYDEIFSDEEKKLADNILLSYKTLEWTRKQHSALKKQFSFVKYAELHSIAMLRNEGITSLADLDKKEAKTKYLTLLKATAELVGEESEKLGDSYSHRQLFIDSSTLGRIKELMVKLSN